MLWRQVRHEFASLVRSPVTLILAVGMPLMFFLMVSLLMGNEVIDPVTQVRMVQYLAPAMASFGIAMATFSLLAYPFAEARSLGILKRQGATPAPATVLLGGRVGAALLLGLIAVALILGTGVAFFELQVYAHSVPLSALTVLVASMTFSAWGLVMAMLLPSPQLTLAVTNGIVIALSFVSQMFVSGPDEPQWAAWVGSFFPLRHMVTVLGYAFTPDPTGDLPWGDLGIVAVWGVVGALLAGRLIGSRREQASPSRRPASKGSEGAGRPADRVPRRDRTPSVVALLRDQAAHARSVLWRDPGSVFFAVAFPALLVVLIPTLNGGGDVRLPSGDLLGSFYAATMAVYGAAVTAYVNMPEGLAEDRERGVLKRVRATPLPGWALLAGRVVGALVVALLTLALIVVVAVVLYRPALPPAWPAALLTFLAATLCFAMLGLAVMSLARSAQACIGITLGTLLPLSFISGIFIVGASLPAALDTFSWVFPLRHAAQAMTDAVSPQVVGSGLSGSHLAVLGAWTLASALVVVRRFRWEAPPDRPRAPVAPPQRVGS